MENSNKKLENKIQLQSHCYFWVNLYGKLIYECQEPFKGLKKLIMYMHQFKVFPPWGTWGTSDNSAVSSCRLHWKLCRANPNFSRAVDCGKRSCLSLCRVTVSPCLSFLPPPDLSALTDTALNNRFLISADTCLLESLSKQLLKS